MMAGYLDPFAQQQQFPQSTAQLDPSGQVVPQPTPGGPAVYPGLPPAPVLEAPAYEPQNPRRAAWTGLLFDLGNYFLSGAKQPLQGLAMQGYAGAIEANRKAAEQQRLVAQQNWQNQYTLGNASLLHGQSQRDFDYKKAQDEAAARSAAAQREVEQNRWLAEQRQKKEAAEWKRRVDVAGAWQDMTAPDGSQYQINPFLPEGENVRIINPQTRLERGEVEAAEARFLQEQEALTAGREMAATAETMLQQVLTGDINVGDLFERAQQVGQGLFWSTETGRKTSQLLGYLENFTLENAAKLKGSFSDKDIELLRSTRPGADADERVHAEFLYQVWAAQQRTATINAQKRKWIEEGKPLAEFPEDQVWSLLKRQYDSQMNDALQSIKSGGSLSSVGRVLAGSPVARD